MKLTTYKYLFAATCVVVLLYLPAAAEEITRVKRFTPAKPIVSSPVPSESDAAWYPEELLRKGQQGWVAVSFRVTADGHIADPRIEDSSGNPKFEEATLARVKDWRFEPATWDGSPVEEFHRTTITFAIAGMKVGVTAAFVRRHDRIVKYLEEGKYEKAEKQIRKLLDDEKTTIYEQTRLWLLLADLASENNDLVEQLNYLRKATASSGKFLHRDMHAELFSVMVQMEINLGQYAFALGIYERLRSLDLGVYFAEQLEPAIQSVRKLIEGPEPLTIPATLEKHKYDAARPGAWRTGAIRNRFQIDGVQGRIDDLFIDCQAGQQTIEFMQETDWQVPVDKGMCSVTISGEPGSTFRLVWAPN